MSGEEKYIPLAQRLSASEFAEVLPHNSFPDGDRTYQQIQAVFCDHQLSLADQVEILSKLVYGMSHIELDQMGMLDRVLRSLLPAGATFSRESVKRALDDIQSLFFHPEINRYYQEGFLLSLVSELESKPGKRPGSLSTNEVIKSLEFYLFP